MSAFIQTIWGKIVQFFASYHLFSDTVDILMVALFIYFVIRLVRDSRAEQLIKGIAVLALLYLVAYVFNLTTVEYLLRAVFDNGFLVLIVIFQPELRRALEQAGHSRAGIMRIFNGIGPVENTAYIDQWNKAISATANAVETLQKHKMGALIVLERDTRLGEIARTGTLLEAEPSGELISNIFFNKAPLHDGAVILRDGKIYAAGCILPLTENQQISHELGTRHRAGVGMSENSDALVIILSEETGTISLADAGELQRNFTRETLEKALADRLLWNREEEQKKFKKFKNRKWREKA